MMVVEALSRLEGGGGGGGKDLIVEAFVGSHSSKALNTAASNISLQSFSWLQIRKVVLPSLGKDLEDICYDAVIIHNWSGAAFQPWLNRGPGEEAVDNAITHLSSFLSPGAPVVVLGVDNEASTQWSESLGKIGTVRCHPEKSLVVARTATTYSLLSRSSTTPTHQQEEDKKPPVVLIVADGDDGAGDKLAQHLRSKGSNSSNSRSVGGNVTMEVQVLTCGRSGKGAVFSDEKGLHWGGALGDVLHSIQENGQTLTSIIYAAGMNDTTILGLQAFDRLTRLSQALLPNSQLLNAIKPPDHDILFWVLTLCSYEGEVIRPNQGVVEGLGKVLVSELGDVSTRLVDLDSLDDLDQVGGGGGGGGGDRRRRRSTGQSRGLRHRSSRSSRVKSS